MALPAGPAWRMLHERTNCTRRLVVHQELPPMLPARLDISESFRHTSGMRTTVTLDDDVLDLARLRARLRSESLGRTLSDLLRRGLDAAMPVEEVDGLVVFRLPTDSPPVTTAEVRRLENEGA